MALDNTWIKEVEESFGRLENYCGQEEYKGWDPYDGLNSKIFGAVPFLKNIELARLVWIQLFKKAPINLRKPFLVPKGYNSKGIALFLSGYCNLLKYQRNANTEAFGSEKELIKKVDYLAKLLVSLRSNISSQNSCWGYNFDWQSKAFYLPRSTPTIVATSFGIEALLRAYSITRNEKYLNHALSAAEFIKNDLNRIPKKEGFMFSYSPLDNQAVYNATLLATRSLSHIYEITKEKICKELAFLSARAVCDLQNADGSFPHSDQVGNRWRDNFHTAFKLESLSSYQQKCSDNTFKKNIEVGFNYWFNHFFDHASGKAYYYDTPGKLVDLHCAAQAIPTFYHLGKFKEYEDFINLMSGWAITNMQDKYGFFYFQKRGNRVVKIPYMRWPNAWMLYGMSFYLLSHSTDEKNT